MIKNNASNTQQDLTPKVMIRGMHTTQLGRVTKGINALGCWISFNFDSQKRREWAKLEGGEMASVKSTKTPFTLAAMVTRALKTWAPAFGPLSSDLFVLKLTRQESTLSTPANHLPGDVDTNGG